MGAAVTETTFEQEVLKSETPVIVDFWAEWCGPCHAVAPVLDRIVEERSGEVKLVKVNIDEEQELARRYGIMSIPTIMLFRDGEPAGVAIGAQPKIARPFRRAPLSASVSFVGAPGQRARWSSTGPPGCGRQT